jgi:hypothetical protein
MHKICPLKPLPSPLLPPPHSTPLHSPHTLAGLLLSCHQHMAGAAASSLATTGAVVASKRRKRGNGSSSAGVAAERKNLGWLGARRRQNRWASEIRMPRTREKIWIGTFSTPEQAALAHDAAIFCLYGAQIPSSRKLNFPAAPRPNIAEHVRVGLTVPNIKAIAENHAHAVAAYLVVPAPQPAPVQVPAAPAPPPPPSAVAVDAAAGAGAASAAATNHGNNDMNTMDAGGVTTIEDYLFAINPEEFDSLDDI